MRALKTSEATALEKSAHEKATASVDHLDAVAGRNPSHSGSQPLTISVGSAPPPSDALAPPPAVPSAASAVEAPAHGVPPTWGPDSPGAETVVEAEELQISMSVIQFS